MSIRTSDADGNTPLHASAKAGHVDLILYFVDQGMPVDLVCLLLILIIISFLCFWRLRLT